MDIQDKLLRDYLNKDGETFEVRSFYLTNTNDLMVKYCYSMNHSESMYDMEVVIDWFEILSFVYSKLEK